MPKKTILTLFIVCLCGLAKAQTPDQVYDQYIVFNEARAGNNAPATIKKGELILPNVDKLPPKTKIVFYNGLAKAYEDNNQFDKATPYYEVVAAAVPDYYVVHRALGYIYLIPAKAINEKMLAEKDKAGMARLMEQYKVAVLKALPHLEKAQACDPSDETLSLIKLLYRNINDTASLQTLNTRLAGLSKNCLDLLSE
jgi:tetratricopeptide (TPR) repeat protein